MDRDIRLPNGHMTAPRRIAAVRVFPDLSEGPHRPYLQVYEHDGLVFEGMMDLRPLPVATTE